MGNKINAIERLTRIKQWKKNLYMDQEPDKLLADNKNMFEKYNLKKNLV